MTNNDILRRLRYILDYSDSKMIKTFAAAEVEIDIKTLSAWLKKDDDAEYKDIDDTHLAIFLNGIINVLRGKKEGPQPAPESKLTYNIVLRKLKIAFNMQAEDMLEIMDLAELRMSKHELSAFFRKADHKHYRECKAQIMRNFLMGLQLKHRPNTEA